MKSTPPTTALKRVLLVEDEEGLRKALAVMLTRAGYEVLQADNADFALLLLKRQPVDVVVSDILLGEKDGIEMLMEVKRHPTQPKFIAMTGGGRLAAEHYLFMAKSLGAFATLNKPFSSDELLAVLRRALD